MKTKGKIAIILGATGLTGGLLLQKLLADDRYDGVKTFTRKPIGIQHPKLVEIPADLLNLKSYAEEFTGDEVYCCIGTTAKKTPDKKLYREIDFGIPVSAAKLCNANGINSFIVVSAIGANANSSIFYNKTKGEMEEAVLNQQIPKTHILQPSLIVGDRNESRFGEQVGTLMMKIFQPILLGPLKKYKAIHANTIANAMVSLANNAYTKKIILSDELQEIGKES